MTALEVTYESRFYMRCDVSDALDDWLEEEGILELGGRPTLEAVRFGEGFVELVDTHDGVTQHKCKTQPPRIVLAHLLAAVV